MQSCKRSRRPPKSQSPPSRTLTSTYVNAFSQVQPRNSVSRRRQRPRAQAWPPLLIRTLIMTVTAKLSVKELRRSHRCQSKLANWRLLKRLNAAWVHRKRKLITMTLLVRHRTLPMSSMCQQKMRWGKVSQMSRKAEALLPGRPSALLTKPTPSQLNQLHHKPNY